MKRPFTKGNFEGNKFMYICLKSAEPLFYLYIPNLSPGPSSSSAWIHFKSL